MLSPQRVPDEPHGRHGRPRADLAELRRRLAEPSAVDGAHRQRLLDLERRLARVHSLGAEYARVQLSEQAVTALRRTAAAV